MAKLLYIFIFVTATQFYLWNKGNPDTSPPKPGAYSLIAVEEELSAINHDDAFEDGTDIAFGYWGCSRQNIMRPLSEGVLPVKKLQYIAGKVLMCKLIDLPPPSHKF